jgi:hypothetical protein
MYHKEQLMKKSILPLKSYVERAYDLQIMLAAAGLLKLLISVVN